MIERIQYIKHRKYSNKTLFITPTCIKDRGLKSKNNVIPASIGLRFEKESEHFTKYGYTYLTHKNSFIRHLLLKKILKKGFDNKWLPLYRKLILLSTLNKNTNKKLSKIYKIDAYWLKKNYVKIY